MELTLRWHALERDAHRRSVWAVREEMRNWSANETALLLCDVWDGHWCRGAVERLDVLLPRMQQVVETARAQGVQIVHAPSDTMDFYADSLARRRALEAPSQIGRAHV